MTSSHGNISALMALCVWNSPITGESPNKGQWREASMFSLIRVLTNSLANNGVAGDLRRYRTLYGVTVTRRRYHEWKKRPYCAVFVRTVDWWRRRYYSPYSFTTDLCGLFSNVVSNTPVCFTVFFFWNGLIEIRICKNNHIHQKSMDITKYHICF